jgi:UTP-glucose-1-phosphate uridylyltransferase
LAIVEEAVSGRIEEIGVVAQRSDRTLFEYFLCFSKYTYQGL